MEIEKRCTKCKRKFFGRPNQIYCSLECRKEVGRKRGKEKHRLKTKKFYKERKKRCLYCNKEFLWTSSKPSQIYCSPICTKKKTREDLKNLSQGILKRKDGTLYNYYRLRFEVFKRDNFTCQYCGRNIKEDKIKLHCDHILPSKKGGKTTFSNLTTSCEECNLGKADVLLSERLNNSREAP